MRVTSQRKAETRERILDAAGALFRTHGIDAVGRRRHHAPRRPDAWRVLRALRLQGGAGGGSVRGLAGPIRGALGADQPGRRRRGGACAHCGQLSRSGPCRRVRNRLRADHAGSRDGAAAGSRGRRSPVRFAAWPTRWPAACQAIAGRARWRRSRPWSARSSWPGFPTTRNSPPNSWRQPGSPPAYARRPTGLLFDNMTFGQSACRGIGSIPTAVTNDSAGASAPRPAMSLPGGLTND